VNVLNLRAERNPTLNDERDKAEQLYRDLENTLVALQSAPDDWFIRSGRGALDDGASGFVARPLTARHHFPRQFLHGGPVVLMSATVGNFATFATELGIKEYGSIEVPNQWEPEARPVYVWKDAPKLGRKANEAAWEQQADIIARMIKEVPATWSGVIHTTSKVQTDRLHAMLADRGLQERLWKTPATGTNNQLHHWQLVKNRFRYQGMIALAWSWHNGVDLGDERICIAAKTPFGSLSSDYDRERMHYDGKFYLQQTAWELQQMCGRTRRGRVQDYDADGQRAGLVAIVDGNWHRVNNYLDASFREAITEWN
jgi:Rad3-related DNA helicase